MRLGGILGALGLLLLIGATARAEPSAGVDRQKLDALVRSASKARQKQDFAACIDALTSALRIEENAIRRGDLGVCEEEAGRDLEAYHDLAEALSSPGADQHKEPFSRFVDPFARVSMRVAHVYLAVDPPEASVIIDGHPRGKAEGRSFILKPGQHTFAARLDGYEDKVVPRSLEAGDAPTVRLSLTPKPKAAATTSAAPSAQITAPSAAATARNVEPEAPWYMPSRDRRGVAVMAAYVTGGAFLVSAAVAIGLEVNRASLAGSIGNKYSCFRGDAQHPITVSPRCDTLDDRKLQANISFAAALGTGVIAGGLGIVALVLNLNRSPRPSITPTVSTNGGGIVFSGAW